MSKYDKGIQLINDILEKKEIIDNDEGILSVAALINIMNKKFDEFWKSFYSKDTLLLIEKGYAYVPEASGLCKIIPFFQDAHSVLFPLDNGDMFRINRTAFSAAYYPSICFEPQREQQILPFRQN